MGKGINYVQDIDTVVEERYFDLAVPPLSSAWHEGCLQGDG